ncbi:MAG: hypothetical protein M0P73_16230 [Syntrophobacterales bacterium]|jgi:hypothetical protein|nr:hypothetical protein [Syntrophobacterales bacterium]
MSHEPRILDHADIEVTCTLRITEDELRALDALAGYGLEPFLKVFYKEMGAHYLKPHEDGLRRLFRSFREEGGSILSRADSARKVFRGQEVGITREVEKVLKQALAEPCWNPADYTCDAVIHDKDCNCRDCGAGRPCNAEAQTKLDLERLYLEEQTIEKTPPDPVVTPWDQHVLEIQSQSPYWQPRIYLAVVGEERQEVCRPLWDRIQPSDTLLDMMRRALVEVHTRYWEPREFQVAQEHETYLHLQKGEDSSYLILPDDPGGPLVIWGIPVTFRPIPLNWGFVLQAGLSGSDPEPWSVSTGDLVKLTWASDEFARNVESWLGAGPYRVWSINHTALTMEVGSACSEPDKAREFPCGSEGRRQWQRI